MEPVNTEHGKIAFKFAEGLKAGDFESAYGLLSEQLRAEWSPELLRKELEEMTDYGNGPVTYLEVMNEMTEWPAKKEEDIGWAYVAMAGEDFSEAVAVVVCNEENEPKIREVEWGRP